MPLDETTARCVAAHHGAISTYLGNEREVLAFAQDIYARGARAERERIAAADYLHLTDGQRESILKGAK